MKKILFVLLSAVLLLSCLCFAEAEETPFMELTADTETLQAGQELRLTVSSDDPRGMAAGRFDLEYDEDLFEFVACETGEALGGASAVNSDVPGRVCLCYASLSEAQPGELFTVTLRVLAEEATSVLVTASDLCDSGLQELPDYAVSLPLMTDYESADETEEAAPEEEPSEEMACVHNGVLLEKTEASCEEDGLERYLCEDCGEEYIVRIPAFGHSYRHGVCQHCGAELPSYEAGDLNGDTRVNMMDMVYFLRYLLGMEEKTFAGDDLNGDGKSSLMDALCFLKWFLNPETEPAPMNVFAETVETATEDAIPEAETEPEESETEDASPDMPEAVPEEADPTVETLDENVIPEETETDETVEEPIETESAVTEEPAPTEVTDMVEETEPELEETLNPAELESAA